MGIARKVEDEAPKAPKPEQVEDDRCACGVQVSDLSGWINNQRMCGPCFDAWLAKAFPLKARRVT